MVCCSLALPLELICVLRVLSRSRRHITSPHAHMDSRWCVFSACVSTPFVCPSSVLYVRTAQDAATSDRIAALQKTIDALKAKVCVFFPVD